MKTHKAAAVSVPAEMVALRLASIVGEGPCRSCWSEGEAALDWLAGVSIPDSFRWVLAPEEGARGHPRRRTGVLVRRLARRCVRKRLNARVLALRIRGDDEVAEA